MTQLVSKAYLSCRAMLAIQNNVKNGSSGFVKVL